MYLTQVSVKEYIEFVRANEKFFDKSDGNPTLRAGMKEIAKRLSYDPDYTEEHKHTDLEYLMERAFFTR
ncbi:MULTISPECIES: hypothetical protein [Pontibacillus]|uniref:Uncharacterized protein n=1 Tax=Pontibacillus chungwhensis TaxID=265426 RepID=A0ABY8V1X5_9BACI|nr:MULTISPECIES: hypothetical protein [Pontibacillus]MCD5324800.1 hypothetical protein [Pontibacillus sp. HN14]WIF98759.1 hypothetical protein QNI29_03655 [Pontibacillus chungwhensis]